MPGAKRKSGIDKNSEFDGQRLRGKEKAEVRIQNVECEAEMMNLHKPRVFNPGWMHMDSSITPSVPP